MSEGSLKRVFVGNRGEIAVRILRTCLDVGVEGVCGLSAGDLESLPAYLADECVCIGPADAEHSYLNVEAIVAAARGTGCEAVHPGYGFLSEQPELAEMCESLGVNFIGPTSETLRQAGDKLEMRRVAEAVGIGTIEGSEHLSTAEEAMEEAERVGYPVMLKAAAGGGGRGMRIVGNSSEMSEEFVSAAAEVSQAFGDGRLYVERYVERGRHIEVQILGDNQGNVIHLGSRDCSSQRRFQKLVEEGPARVPESLEGKLEDAAVQLAHELGYVGAGTVEFLLDMDAEDFSLLEVNARLQVEHPVTEAITGVDIVEEQFRISEGKPLRVSQEDVVFHGHAVECRVNAEDPLKGFSPSPGRIERWVVPSGRHIRVDTHCYGGYVVPPFYDSLLGKIIAWGECREEAVDRLVRALEKTEIRGVPTTVEFQKKLLEHPRFRKGDVTAGWVEEVRMEGVE